MLNRQQLNEARHKALPKAGLRLVVIADLSPVGFSNPLEVSVRIQLYPVTVLRLQGTAKGPYL